MKVPTLRKPRKGWYRQIGPVLLGVNWSGDWDGWGDSKDDGKRVVYYTIGFHPWIASYGWGAIFYLWRLTVQIGIATQPEPPQ